MNNVKNLLEKFNKEIVEAKNFSGWLKLMVFSILWMLIIFPIVAIFDLENLAPDLLGYLMWLTSAFLSGYICYVLAKSKKRTGSLWFILGLILNWVAITIIFIMPESSDGVF